jgi:hypothetical protein
MKVNFVEELQYEASRRELKVFASKPPVDAANHVIARAAEHHICADLVAITF